MIWNLTHSIRFFSFVRSFCRLLVSRFRLPRSRHSTNSAIDRTRCDAKSAKFVFANYIEFALVARVILSSEFIWHADTWLWRSAIVSHDSAVARCPSMKQHRSNTTNRKRQLKVCDLNSAKLHGFASPRHLFAQRLRPASSSCASSSSSFWTNRLFKCKRSTSSKRVKAKQIR